MYISSVKNVIFSFQDLFLKRGEKKIFFQEKTLKKKEVMKIPFSPLSLPFLPPPSKE